MYVLRRLPFSEQPTHVTISGETVPVRPYQIIVWVSLSGSTGPRIPAILDTGHGHNFSVQERQMADWASVRVANCPRLGMVLVNRLEVPLLQASLFIHRNRLGTAERLPRPVALLVPEGIAVYLAGTPNAPRLPILGLRGLVRNGMRFVIDGTEVSLRIQS